MTPEEIKQAEDDIEFVRVSFVSWNDGRTDRVCDLAKKALRLEKSGLVEAAFNLCNEPSPMKMKILREVLTAYQEDGE